MALDVLIACAVAGAVAFGVGLLATVLLRWFARRADITVEWVRVWRSPIVSLFVALAVRNVLADADPDGEWADWAGHLLDITVILSIAWILVVITHTIEHALLDKYPATSLEDRSSRHARTKIALLRKVADAVVITGAIVACLWTIPDVRRVGVGILASAGVVGIVFGLAAQTSLANLFAGVQIAFTDAIRVDDIVVIDGQYGRIDEITLTYVVVKVWDGTSLILPCTYFTTTPFSNWTHQRTSTMGLIEFGVDWTVPVDDVRAELRRAVQQSPNWDGETVGLRVDDTSGPVVTLTAVVSAADGDRCNALRWDVREALLKYDQTHHPTAFPRNRQEQVKVSTPT